MSLRGCIHVLGLPYNGLLFLIRRGDSNKYNETSKEPTKMSTGKGKLSSLSGLIVV